MGNKINLYKDKWVGDTKPVFIIAEIGSNHNQSLEIAKESIVAAKESGADAVKFQSLNVNELYYQPSESIISLHKRIDLNEDWHFILKDFCDKHDIAFFSSPTYMRSVEILEQINVPFYKLASAQIGTFPQLIEKVAFTGKPVILSTGIVVFSELDKVIEIFKKANNNQYIILHCNSIYPTPYDKVHLNLINEYKERYNCVTGFSDHTSGTFVPALAVAKGAKIIEKHFTLDKNLPVPDAPFSLDPKEFEQMVSQIRIAEKVIAISNRQILEIEEEGFKSKILYRLVINKGKSAGETIEECDLSFKRNPQGIDCREMSQIIGKKLKAGVKSNTLLEYKHF